MAVATTVTATYIADTTRYVNGMRAAVNATQQLTDALPHATDATDRLGVKGVAVGTALGQLGAMVMAKATASITRYARQGISAAAQYEQTVISMQGIFQGTGMSMEEAAKKTESYLGDLRDFAAKTPFELPQTLNAVKRLLSIGYAADEVKDRMLPAIGDIVSALGMPASSIDGIVYAMGQMKSAGRVMSQDLMQIGNALPGFNAKVALATELYGGDMQKLQKATESGALNSEMAIDTLITAMQKFPGAAGAMERQSKTLNGVMSTFKDTVNNALIDGLMPAMPVLSEALNKLVGPVSDLATAFAQALGPALIKIVESAQEFIPVITGMIVKLLGFIPVIMNVVGFMLKLAPAIAALVVPIALVALGFKAWNTATGYVDKMTEYITKMKTAIESSTKAQLVFNAAQASMPALIWIAVAVAALVALAVAFKVIYDRSKPLRDAVSRLFETFKSIASVIMNDVLGAFGGLTGEADKANSAFGGIGAILQKVADIVGPILAVAVDSLTNYIKIMANYVRVVIKVWEIVFKILYMVANLIRVSVIATFNALGKAIGWVLDNLGPVGKAVKHIGEALKNAFSNIGTVIKNAIQGAVGFIEKAINVAIDAINKLIDAYNMIPGVSDVARVDPFQFSGFGAGPVDTAVSDSRKAAANADAAARVNASLKALKKDPPTTPAPVDGAKKAKDALDALTKKFDDLKESLLNAADSYKNVMASTENRFGQPSAILKAFGTEGDISSVISQYDQMDASLRDYYTSLAKAPGVSKKVAAGLKANMDQVRKELKDMTQKSVDLMVERKRIQDALSKLDEDYGKTTDGINNTFDDLDKAAAAESKRIQDYYDKLIPALEKALNDANAAFDKENAVLQTLVDERKKFTDSIASGFRSFMNAVSSDGGDFKSNLEQRLRDIQAFTANIRALVSKGLDPTLIQEFVNAGVANAGQTVAQLANASAGDIAAINASQMALASEVASFGTFASSQWFDAGIAQQEAIVGPLRAAAQAARDALDLATVSRDAEVAAAKAHEDALKVSRQAALEQARLDYVKQHDDLREQMRITEVAITANANAIQAKLLALGITMPPEMATIGRAAVQGLINGMTAKEGALIAKARALGNAVKRALEDALDIGSPSRVTRTIGEQVAAGLVLGMEQSMNDVRGAAAAMGGAALPSAGAMNGISGGALGGGSGVVVQNFYDITVPTLIGDKRETGQIIVETIKSFERANGPVFQGAS
jgi:tape measure domain-containing protein